MLDDDALTRLAAACRQRTYRKGQFIFYQGDSGDTLLVVCDGLVKVVFASEAGEETVLVTLGACEVVGQIALLDGEERSASVVAVEPTTGLLLTRATVLDVMVRHPAVLDAMLRSLGRLVRRLTEQAGDFASSTSAADSRSCSFVSPETGPKQRTVSCWTSASPSPTSPRWSARAVRR